MTKNVNTSGNDKKTLDLVSKRKIFYIISAALVAISLLASLFGVDIAIEFKGGTMVSYSFDGEIDNNAAKKVIEEAIGEKVNVQQGDMFKSDKKNLVISLVSSEGLTADKQSALTESLETAYPDNGLEILDSTNVAASSGINFFTKCIVAVVFSSIILILYIALRFKRISGWSSGVCAVIALLHDVIITYGAFIIIGFQINSNFVAVVLTILGCSINNTIVVYDRIRENKKLMPGASIEDLVNTSTVQSVTRSIRTTVSTIVTMIIISIVAGIRGVSSIQSFAIPLIVGMTVGTYSSLLLAPSLWVSWQKASDKKHPSKKAKA
ncbi:MAG: protein translocase subunit SecF [Oscillospiraceae bacterium]|nr:protein translocase subunit SecF [Oscillospiraceae bacterium]